MHTGAAAEKSAAALETDAFALGHHIVFRSPQERLATPAGRALLEHEAFHTLQAAPAAELDGVRVSSAGDAAERAAMERPAPTTRSVERAAKPTIFRAPPPGTLDLGESLAQNADPMMARVVGSGAVDGFVTGQSEIPPAQMPALQALARRLRPLLERFPGARIRITGHTDAVGAAETNETLGLARATAVKAALVPLGIPAEALDIETKGKRELLVVSKNAEARNRRAQIQFEPPGGYVRRPQAVPPPAPSAPLPTAPAPDRPEGTAPTPPAIKPRADKTPKDPSDKSPFDALNEQIDRDLREAKPHLPPFIYDQLKNGTHAAAKALITKILEGALDIGPVPDQAKAILHKLLDLLDKKPSDFTKSPDPDNRGNPWNRQGWYDSPGQTLPGVPNAVQGPPFKF